MKLKITLTLAILTTLSIKASAPAKETPAANTKEKGTFLFEKSCSLESNGSHIVTSKLSNKQSDEFVAEMVQMFPRSNNGTFKSPQCRIACSLQDSGNMVLFWQLLATAKAAVDQSGPYSGPFPLNAVGSATIEPDEFPSPFPETAYTPKQ